MRFANSVVDTRSKPTKASLEEIEANYHQWNEIDDENYFGLDGYISMSPREAELEEKGPDLPEKRQDFIHYEVPRKLLEVKYKPLNGFPIADHGGVPPDQGTSPPFPTPSDPSPLIPAITDQSGAQPDHGTGFPPPSPSMAYQPVPGETTPHPVRKVRPQVPARNNKSSLLGMIVLISMMSLMTGSTAHLIKPSVTHVTVMMLTKMIGRTKANNMRQGGEDTEEKVDGEGLTKIEFYRGETLRIQCKSMDKYRGIISWTTEDPKTPLPSTAETEGSFLTIKRLNYSIPKLTCHVQKGMIAWNERFKLQLLKTHEVRHKKHKGIPSALKAYACDSAKSEPLAEFNLGVVEQCRFEDFQSYTVEPSTQSV